MKQVVSITLEEDLVKALMDLKEKLKMRSLSATVEMFVEAGITALAKEPVRRKGKK